MSPPVQLAAHEAPLARLLPQGAALPARPAKGSEAGSAQPGPGSQRGTTYAPSSQARSAVGAKPSAHLALVLASPIDTGGEGAQHRTAYLTYETSRGRKPVKLQELYETLTSANRKIRHGL